MNARRLPAVLVVLLVVAAYFAGSLVAAGSQPKRDALSPHVTISVEQVAAIKVADALLLGEDEESGLYLPLVVR